MRDAFSPSDDAESHLSRISTQSGLTVQDLALRYQRAIERFLRKVLRDDDAAADLTQDILVKLLRGDFGRWEGRGRFRDYLKAAVRHAAIAHLKSSRKPDVTAVDAVPEAGDSLDDLWDVEWATEIKTLAWHSLQRYQLKHRRTRNQHGGSPNVFYTLLRLRLKYPRDKIPQLTQRLVEKTGRSFTQANVRQQLARARRKLVEFLKREVVTGLPPDGSAAIDLELLAHNLAEYVRKLSRSKMDTFIDPQS
jgi:hypothetical protein